MELLGGVLPSGLVALVLGSVLLLGSPVLFAGFEGSEELVAFAG